MNICLGETVRGRGGSALERIGPDITIPGAAAPSAEVQDMAGELSGTPASLSASLRLKRRKAIWKRWPEIWKMN